MGKHSIGYYITLPAGKKKKGMLDMVTSVLASWSPAQLRAVVALLHATLTACPGVDPASGTEVCDTNFAATAMVPLVQPPVAPAAASRLPLASPAVLLEVLGADMAVAEAAAAAAATTWSRECSTRVLAPLAMAARAWFMVLLVMDGRVRRLAFTDCVALHGAMGTCAPARARIARFLGDGRAAQTVCAYLNDVDALAAAGDAPAVAQQTAHLVAFLTSWWTSGAPLPPLAWDATLGGVFRD